MQLPNTIYTVLHERSNITTSFTEHLKFQQRQKKIFTYLLWINCSKLKYKNYNQDILYIENVIYRVLHERSNKTA